MKFLSGISLIYLNTCFMITLWNGSPMQDLVLCCSLTSYSINLTGYLSNMHSFCHFCSTEGWGHSNILRLYAAYRHTKSGPVANDSIAVLSELTLPSLLSNSEAVLTAWQRCVSQWLIPSNWVMTTIQSSDTCTRRLVQSLASATLRN